MNRDVKNIKKVLVVLGIYGCVAQAAKKQAVEKGYEFVWKKPSISWHFNHPSGVVVDSSGNVYVVDIYNNRIQKFDSQGAFITKWGSNGTW